MVGGAAAIQGGLYLTDLAEPAAWMWALGVVAIVSGFALVIGFLTPGSGAVAGLSTILIVMTWNPSTTSNLFIDNAAALFVTADAAAVALLGPGAHSMDAYLFGRREIIIPHQLPRR